LILYKCRAKHRKGYGIHSPFLFDLIKNVLNNTNFPPEIENFEKLRTRLKSDRTIINVLDLGAGSKVMHSNKRTVKDIIKHSAVKKKYARLIFNLAHHYQLKSILELGTSLGLGTLYLAATADDADVYTIEGCPETARFASERFKEFGKNNIHQIIGDIDKVLPNVMKKKDSFDFVYFDGNHTKDATLRYFSNCLEKIGNHTVYYFDDIHWSKGMEDAWEQIKKNEKVTLTIDLFHSGIVFFRKELSKQNFKLRF
jgi:predicted O-methyltransferase YrrM